MTNEELTTAYTTLSGMIDLLPTREDISVLTALINSRHVTLITAVSDLESRIVLLEEAFLNHATNTTIHN